MGVQSAKANARFARATITVAPVEGVMPAAPTIGNTIAQPRFNLFVLALSINVLGAR